MKKEIEVEVGSPFKKGNDLFFPLGERTVAFSYATEKEYVIEITTIYLGKEYVVGYYQPYWGRAVILNYKGEIAELCRTYKCQPIDIAVSDIIELDFKQYIAYYIDNKYGETGLIRVK